jgi:hypothetical protein
MNAAKRHVWTTSVDGRNFGAEKKAAADRRRLLSLVGMSTSVRLQNFRPIVRSHERGGDRLKLPSVYSLSKTLLILSVADSR